MSLGYELAYPTGTATGLTKRELFAAMAMQGILSNPTYLQPSSQDAILREYGKDQAEWTDLVAWVAASHAEALLEELEKPHA